MSNIQVKDVPKPLHDELRRRAELAGKTIRDYVLELIRRDQLAPSREEWLSMVRSLKPLDLGEHPAEAIRAVRQERDARRR